MMRTRMKILLRVRLFPKKTVRERAIIISRDENIQERKVPISLCFHRELDGVKLTIQVLMESL